jgi:bisphosphoglycerate-dependent phosphoglycerate mutase
MHINWVISDTNARDETLMETKQSLDPFWGHKIDVLEEEKRIFFLGHNLFGISSTFIVVESLSDDIS